MSSVRKNAQQGSAETSGKKSVKTVIRVLLLIAVVLVLVVLWRVFRDIVEDAVAELWTCNPNQTPTIPRWE